MDMHTYFKWNEFTRHPRADHYRKMLDSELAPGEIREGMLRFKDDAGWGGAYPGNTVHFMLLDQRLWGYKYSGLPFAEAQKIALTMAQDSEMLARIKAGDADVVHQVLERGTQEHPIRIWCMGTDDTSYSKWFKTVEDAEALLILLESFDDLDFDADFMAFDWTFTN